MAKKKGTAGNDVVSGTNGDFWDLLDGNDRFNGGSFSDTAYGGTGDDSLYGGGGNDKLYGGDGSDLLDGGTGDDSLYGDGGSDTILGGDGNDYVSGSAGADSLSGGAGSDTIYGGGGSDTIDAGEGNNEIHAGTNGGNDDDDDDDSHGAVSSADVIYAGSGNDTIYAGSGNDNIFGGNGDNRIYGGRGNDRITFGDGNNQIYGGGGADSVYGGNGNNEINLGGDGNGNGNGNGADFVQVGSGNDTIYGGNGSDTILAGDGNNFLRLGSGNDSVIAGSGNDTIYGGAGNDTIDAGGGNNYVRGGTGNDNITAGSGNDSIEGYEGNDRINAGDGNNFIRLGAGSDTVTAGSGNDTVVGGSSADLISVGGGNDSVEAGDGNDSVEAGRGSDTVNAGDGNDVVGNTFSTADRDRLDGGRGTDQLRLDFTRAEWMSGAVQTDIDNYLRFLSTNSNAGSSSGRTFEFASMDLDVRNFEGLSVTVDGVALTAADDAVDAVNDTGSVDEDHVLTGSVLGNDAAPDLIASVQLVTPPAQGSLTFNADGTYSFTPGAAFQHLAEGATATTSFTYRVTDADGDSDVATVTITVIGTNDGPVAVADSAQVDENAAVTVDVLANDSDVDDGHAFTLTGVSVAQGQGTAAIVGNKLVYATGNDFESLAQGETRTVTVTYSMRDEFGAVSTATTTVTVTGTNDAPIITSAAQSGAVKEDGVAVATGQVTASDVDHNAVLTYAVANTAGAYGSLGIDAQTGAWTYSLANNSAAVQALAAGEIHVETFTVSVTDEHGAAATQTVSVTVTGTNDAPVVTSGAQTGSLQEDSVLAATGQVTASDADSGATRTFSVDNATGAYGTLGVNAQTGAWTYTLGNGSAAVQSLAQGESHVETFDVRVTDDQGVSAVQQVSVTVQGTNDAPVIAEPAGPTGAVLRFNGSNFVTFHDTNFGSTWNGNQITFEMWVKPDAIGVNQFIMNSGFLPVAINSAGHLVVRDVVSTGTIQAGEWTHIAFTQANGQWNIYLDGQLDRSVAHDFVGGLFTYSIGSSQGHVATETFRGEMADLRLWNVARTGAQIDASNDSHVAANSQGLLANWYFDEGSGNLLHNAVSGGTFENASGGTVWVNDATPFAVPQAAAVEDSVQTVTGALSASDVDHGAVLAWSVDQPTGAYGSLAVNNAGQWTYTLANNVSAVQTLAQGESHVETFTVRVTDEHGASDTQSVSITVQGTNDAPVITSSAQSGAVQEEFVLIATGQVTASDVDHNAVLTYVVENRAGAFGGLQVNAQTGEWTYTLANDSAAVQALAGGEVRTDTFTVHVTDEHGATAAQTVTINVTGTADAPVITSGPQAGAVQEDSVLAAAGQVTAIDNDPGSFVNYDVQAPSGTYGTLSVGFVNGGWAYDLDNSRASVQSLAEGESVTDTFVVVATDNTGLSATQEVTITVQGSNDAPVIADAVTVLDFEGSFPVDISGYPHVNDGYGGFVWSTSNSQDDSLPAADFLASGDVFVLNGARAGWNGYASQFTAIVREDGGDFDFYGAAFQNYYGVGHLTLHGYNDGVEVGTEVIGISSQYEDFSSSLSGIDQLVIEVSEGVIPVQNGALSGWWSMENFRFSTAQDASVTEDTDLTAGGVLTATDIDHGAVLTWSADDTAGAYGTLALDQSGAWSYALDNAAVQSLGAGESRTDDFVVRVTDEHGAFDTRTLSINIHGANDAPMAAAITGEVGEDGAAIVLTPSFSDPDANDTHTISLLSDSLSSSSSAGHATANELQLAEGGVVTLNPDGTISFNPDGDFDDLAPGEQRTVSFQYVVTDSAGASSTANATVTVHGQNDAPSIENLSAGGPASNTSGTFAFFPVVSDADAHDQHFINLQDGVGGPEDVSLSFAGGAFAYVHVGSEIFFEQNGAFEYLGANEIATVSFQYVVHDSYGGTDTANIDILVSGRNEDPLASNIAASVDEDADALVLTPSFTDVDLTDTHSITLRANVRSAGGSAGSMQIETGNDLTFFNGAHISLNPDGTISFEQNGSYNSLDDGETASIEFEYIVTDNFGGESIGNVVITINGVTDPVASLVAVDDVFDPGSGSGSGGLLTFDDQSLVGFSEGNGYYAYDGSYGQTYGDFVFGNTSYYSSSSIDPQIGVVHGWLGYYGYYQPSIARVDGESFSLTSFDVGQGYYDYGPNGFPIEVVGYLDGAAIAFQTIYPVYSGYLYDYNYNTNQYNQYQPATHVELNPAFSSVDLVVFYNYSYGNDIAFDNIDAGGRSSENFQADFAVLGNDTSGDPSAVLTVQSVQGTSALGATVTINPDGTIHYDGRLAAGADALTASQQADDTFTYTVVDQFGNSDTATVTVHLTGVDDRSVAVDDNATVVALAGGNSVSGNLLGNDTDPDSTPALLNAPGDYFVSYGTVALSADGSFTYTVNSADVAFLGAGETINSQFTYQLAGGDTALLTITIQGVNDGPVAAADLLNDGVHDAFTTAGAARSDSIGRLLGNDFDPDNNDSVSLLSVSGTSAAGATVVWNTETNQFTYDAGNVTAFQSLAEGETVTDSFTYTIRDTHGVETTGTAQVVVAGNPEPPVAVDDSFDRVVVDTSHVLTFDDPIPNLNGPYESPYEGFEFTGFWLAGYYGANFSNTAYTWSENNWAAGGSDGSFRTADGSNFDLNGFNATTWSNYTSNQLLQVRGYDNGTEVASADFVLTYLEYEPNHVHVFGLGADFNSVDEVRFYMPSYEYVDGQYWYPNYLWLDDVAIGAIAAGEDIVGNLNVLANDMDASALHVSATSGVSQLGATITINADGTLAYNPLASVALQGLDVGETLTDTFTYTVTDAYGLSDTATVTVVVGGADDPSVAVDDTASAVEDGAVISGNLLTNDYDPEGHDVPALAANSAGQFGNANGAVLTLNQDGSYTYAVNDAFQALAEGQTATDVFTYTLDGGDTGTLTVTVSGSNDAPVAQNDSVGGSGAGAGGVPGGYILNPDNGHYYRFVGTNLNLDQHMAAAAAEGAYVLTLTSYQEQLFVANNLTSFALLGASDRDSEGHWLWLNGPEAGQEFWTGMYYDGFAPNGAYTAWNSGEPNNAGDEDIVYMFSASQWNDAYAYFQFPTVYEIGGMGPFTDENTVGAFDAARLLTNDHDIDSGAVLHVVSVAGTSLYGATVTFNSQTGQISYDATSAAAVQALLDGEVLTDVFTYTMADEHGATSTATVSVTVGGITENEAPTAIADTASGTEDSVSITGAVLANDTDPDAGDVLSVSDAGVRQGTYGVLTLNADGTFSYVPDPVAQALAGGQVVSDIFAYTAADAGGLTSQSTLAVQLTGVNDAAVVSGNNFGEVFEDGVLVAGGDLNAADPDNAADSWQAASGTSRNGIGSFTIGTDGVWTYTLDNANPFVQAANAGDRIADFFVVRTQDRTEQTVFLAVNGADDVLNLSGTNGDDMLIGGPGPDTLTGLDGNDVIVGNGGADVLSGGNGNDSVSGNEGDDTILGGLGTDTLDGGPGTDTLLLPQLVPQNNVAVTISINLVTGTYTVNNVSFGTLVDIENVVGAGNSLFVTGTAGPNYLYSGSGGSLTGGDGNDTLDAGGSTLGVSLNGGIGDDLLISGPGNDSFITGPGIDTLSYQNAPQGVAYNLSISNLTQTNPGSGSDRTSAGPPPENLIGSAFNDTLTGSSSVSSGLINANVIDGAAGNDVLSGLAGNDTLIGGTGDDLLTGGLDLDNFVFRPGDGIDSIIDFTVGADNIVMEGFGPDIDTFAEIATHLVQSNADTVINLSATQTITLVNVTASLLTQDDFIFQ
jgi:VCBS repeat-containing protein